MGGMKHNNSVSFCATVLSAIAFCATVWAADYVVAVDRETQEDVAWQVVVDALKAKHQAKVLVYGDSAKLNDLLPGLRREKPKYVCFVSKPERVGRVLVVNAAQLLRRIDDDSYGDALWGIITGYDAADALRLARTPKAREIGRIATSEGTPEVLNDWDGGFSSDEANKDNFWFKEGSAPVKWRSTGGNPARALAEAFNTSAVDYFLTSGHATQHDWQIVYNRNEGSLRHDAEANLFFMNPLGEMYPVKSSSPKIYLPAGNCLIGDIDQRACMVTSWIHSGGVEQFCGYTCVTFFGFMGWGVRSQLEEARCAFSEAYYLQNQLLLWALSRKKDGQLATLSLAVDNFGGGRRVNAFIDAHKKDLCRVEDGREVLDNEALGLLWDRDVVAFYGDPAERVTYPESRRTFRVTVKGEALEVTFLKDLEFGPLMDVKAVRPVMALLDEPPAGTCLLDAAGTPVAQAVVNDRFLLIPVTGRHAAGETLHYRFSRTPPDLSLPSPGQRGR